MTLAKPVSDYTATRVWLDALREQWGREPDDVHERLTALETFCGLVDKTPDEIIAECSMEVDGGKRIRLKGRRFYSEKIEELQASVEGDARTRQRWGNTIRSFLIHNGIFIQAGLSA